MAGVSEIMAGASDYLQLLGNVSQLVNLPGIGRVNGSVLGPLDDQKRAVDIGDHLLEVPELPVGVVVLGQLPAPEGDAIAIFVIKAFLLQNGDLPGYVKQAGNGNCGLDV